VTASLGSPVGRMAWSVGRWDGGVQRDAAGSSYGMASRSALKFLVSVSAVAQGACFLPHPGVGRVTPQPCLPSGESIVIDAAWNAVADRLAKNRARLPWTDSAPPAPVTEAAICARAADAYARSATASRQPGPTRGLAGVVRAGGLYFVVSPPAHTAGEFTIVGVLDGEFRWLVGLTM